MRLDGKSRMSREARVRFRENAEGKFPRATRPDRLVTEEELMRCLAAVVFIKSLIKKIGI